MLARSEPAALCRDVAQPGRALAWGARGRQFKSARPDQSIQKYSQKLQACPLRFHISQVSAWDRLFSAPMPDHWLVVDVRQRQQTGCGVCLGCASSEFTLNPGPVNDPVE